MTLTNGDAAFAAGTYYVAILPGTYSQGLVFTFANNEGKEVVKGISGNLVLNAGEVANIGTVGTLNFNAEAVEGLQVKTIYQENGANAGVVFWVDPLDPTKGKVISGAVSYVKWSPNGTTFSHAADIATGDSMANHNYVVSLSDYSAENYPATYFCASLGSGWRLPSYNELTSLVKTYFDVDGELSTTIEYAANDPYKAAAAEFDALIAQCFSDDPETTDKDESKITVGKTTWYWTSEGDTSSSKIRRVKVNSKYAAGVTSMNNGDTIARCVRDIEVK